MRTIKYCCRNEKFGSKSVYKALKSEHPELKQKKKDCLSNCKLCKKQCIVMVGKKEVLCAESADALYMQLKELIAAASEERVPVM